MKRSGNLKRKPLKRGKPPKKKGRLTTLWESFRAKKLIRDRDEEGTIVCQDYLIGLPRCNERSDNPDLHHVVGRDTNPSLYFDDKNLVWLVRDCHEAAHKR